MNLLAVGFNHTTTPVAMRERLAVPHDELGHSLQALVQEAKLEEAMLLSTCNRTEIYAVRKDGGGDLESFGAKLSLSVLVVERADEVPMFGGLGAPTAPAAPAEPAAKRAKCGE